MSRKIFGLSIIVMALAVATLPQFYNCAHDGKFLTLANGMQAPMKCLWTAQAELAVGLPLAALGAMMAFSRRKEVTRSLAVMGAILGAFVVLLPTGLIGVCTSMAGSCNLVMRPSMMLLGTLVVAASLGALATSLRETRPVLGQNAA